MLGTSQHNMLRIFTFLWIPYHTCTYMPPEVLDIFFGDLTMNSLFPPETTDDNFTEAELKNILNLDVHAIMRNTIIADNSIDDDIENQDLKNVSTIGQDVKEYNDASATLSNFTRRGSWSIYHGHVDQTDKRQRLDLELIKISMLKKLCLMYLHHSRYKIEKAFKQRELYRNDKRYHLGYLFNRMRRIKTEMLKIAVTARTQYYFNAYKTRQNLTSLLRMYERMVRFDVDMRDTEALIKELFVKDAPYDTSEAPRVTPTPQRRYAGFREGKKRSESFYDFMADHKPPLERTSTTYRRVELNKNV